MVSNLCRASDRLLPERNSDALSKIGLLSGKHYTILVEGDSDKDFWPIILKRYFSDDSDLFDIHPCGDKDKAIETFLKSPDDSKYILIVDSDYDHRGFSGKHHNPLYKDLSLYKRVIKSYGYNIENYLTNVILIYNLIKPGLKKKYKELSLRDLEMITESMFNCIEDLVLFDAFFVRNHHKNFPSRKIDNILSKSLMKNAPFISRDKISELIENWCNENDEELGNQNLYEAIKRYSNHQKNNANLSKQNINGKIVLKVLLKKIMAEYSTEFLNQDDLKERLLGLLSDLIITDISELPESFKATVEKIEIAFSSLRDQYPVNFRKVRLL